MHCIAGFKKDVPRNRKGWLSHW